VQAGFRIVVLAGEAQVDLSGLSVAVGVWVGGVAAEGVLRPAPDHGAGLVVSVGKVASPVMFPDRS